MQTRNQLPPPTVCDNCSSDRIGLTSNAVVYGEPKGDWPYCYYCDDCSAMVNCHSNTRNPLGLMANGTTRRKRMRLHILFDPIWHQKLMTRDDAYKWLGSQLGMDVECHIGTLNKDQLSLALDIMTAHSNNDYALFRRRKVKANAKRNARNERENGKIGRRKSQ